MAFCGIFCQNKCISGVMVNVIVSSVVEPGVESRLGKAKD